MKSARQRVDDVNLDELDRVLDGARQEPLREADYDKVKGALHGSGAATREAREKLIEAARRREIDVVLVWRLDRWGRSVTDLPATLQELEHLGVGFVSLTEALDLTTPAGRAMAGLLAIFVEFAKERFCGSELGLA